jgi:Spy/CpxP family protein refolding chaperone
MKAIFLSILSLSVMISMSYAQGYHKTEFGGHPKLQLQKRIALLDLNDAQSDKITSTRDKTKKEIIPIKSEIQLKRIDLKNELMAEQPNRNKIMKLTEEISDLQLKVKKAQIDEKLQIQSILTPEQREQLLMPRYKFFKELEKKD